MKSKNDKLVNELNVLVDLNEFGDSMIALAQPRRKSKSTSKANKSVKSKKATGTRKRLTKAERQRELLKLRLERLLNREISFIGNDEFKSRVACRSILGEPLDLDFVPEIQVKAGSKLPTHLSRLCDAPLLTNDEEKTLFRRMNYTLYRANLLRTKLSVRRPNEEKIAEVEQLLKDADALKNRISVANIRLVISIVKQLAPNPTLFEELLSDGLIAVIRSVEKFDFDRGFRFSTYATMVIRRQLYRSMKNDHRDRTRFTTGEQSIFTEHPELDRDPRIGYQGWVQLNASLTTLMGDLDERERHIIRARFGFDTDGKKQTLQSLAKEFGVCKERVRQLEKRAMTKLRTLADGFELEGLLNPEFS